jgi:hypothetical protein
MSMLVKQGKTKYHEIVPLNHHKQPPRPPRAALLTSAHFTGGQREQKKLFHRMFTLALCSSSQQITPLLVTIKLQK